MTASKLPPRKRLAHVVEVEPLGAGLGRIDVEAEGLGMGVLPGRFAMVEAIGRPDCVLLRPFSYFSVDSTHRIGFLLRDVGAGTRTLLQARPGDPIHVLGPLGSTFPEPGASTWAVAGGVGAAPFGMFPRDVGLKVLFGARSDAEAGFARALAARGAQVVLATDDGSSGFVGNVVELLDHQLKTQPPPTTLFTCGPTPMMMAVARLARGYKLRCIASLEERMGCGIGVCRGCAHRDASGAWRCICVDGPVYDATDIFT